MSAREGSSKTQSILPFAGMQSLKMTVSDLLTHVFPLLILLTTFQQNSTTVAKLWESDDPRQKNMSWILNPVPHYWIFSDPDQGVCQRLPRESAGYTGTSRGWLFFPKQNV